MTPFAWRVASVRGRQAAVALGCGGALTLAQAAGGHFAVDDVAILEPGQCQLETWWERGDTSRRLGHVGPACRVGLLELALNADRTTASGRAISAVVGPQVKWATAVDDRLDVGVVALAGWQGRAAHLAGASLYAPASLQVTHALWLHANAGRDWIEGSSARWRSGLATEWQVSAQWSGLVERFRQSGETFTRAGTRWQIRPDVSVDLSRAAGGARTGGWWSLGINWTIERSAQ